MALVGELSGVTAPLCLQYLALLTGEVLSRCSLRTPGCADRDQSTHGPWHRCLQRSTAGIKGDPPAAYAGRQELCVLGRQ
jgi:hypothetical protein